MKFKIGDKVTIIAPEFKLIHLNDGTIVEVFNTLVGPYYLVSHQFGHIEIPEELLESPEVLKSSLWKALQ